MTADLIDVSLFGIIILISLDSWRRVISLEAWVKGCRDCVKNLIGKPIRYAFLGGYISLNPPFTGKDKETGEKVDYPASVKVLGLGKFPVKLSPAFIEKLVQVFHDSEIFRGFVDEVAKIDARENADGDIHA